MSDQQQPPISAEELARLEQNDLANIRAKIEAKKPLTESERRRLEAIASRHSAPAQEEEQWVDSIVALSEALECDRKTIQRWQKTYDDWPKPENDRYSVPAWRSWAKGKGLRVASRKVADKASLDCDLLKLKIESQEIDNAERRGELCSVEEVFAVLTPLFSHFQTELRAMKNDLAVEVTGLSVPEAAKRIGRRVLQSLETLSLGDTAKKKAFWRTVSARLSALLANFSLGDGPESTAHQHSASV